VADTFGALSFPLVAPAAGTPPGDPALGVVASYLTAALNAQCGAAWDVRGVCPGRQVVEKSFTHDPKRLFDDSKLPALYVWGTKSQPEVMAADLIQDTRTINIFWCMEGAQEEHQIKRSSMFNAVAKTIQRALRNGREPSWVVVGDTETYAATEGSLYMIHAGFSRVVRGAAQPQELEIYILDGEGKPIPFSGLATSMEVVEFIVDDPNLGTYDAAVDVNITNAASTEMGSYEDLPT
jgi:hypothetical protein